MGVRNRSKVMSTPTNLNLIDDKYHGHQAFSLKNGLVGSLGAKRWLVSLQSSPRT